MIHSFINSYNAIGNWSDSIDRIGGGDLPWSASYTIFLDMSKKSSSDRVYKRDREIIGYRSSRGRADRTDRDGCLTKVVDELWMVVWGRAYGRVAAYNPDQAVSGAWSSLVEFGRSYDGEFGRSSWSDRRWEPSIMYNHSHHCAKAVISSWLRCIHVT